MGNLLEVQHIHKNFCDFALQDLSFNLPAGFIMGFIGHNGAGKTTTIKLILNMLHLDQGKIQVFGLDHLQNEEKIKEQVGVIMDHPYFVEDWNLVQVAKAVAPFYKNWNPSRYEQLLHEFHLISSKKVKELSRGMKMKLMIAVALSHDAKLLILDEPTSGLDPVARDELMDILTNYITDENRGILFSTHITTDLERIADYITFIANGKLLFSGLKEDLLERYALVKGGLGLLTQAQKKLIYGYRGHQTGFEGLIHTDHLSHFSNDFLIEPASLDQIIIHMNKEDTNHV